MIKNLDFENLFLRSKVAIPFVEDNNYLPEKVFVDGIFPAGTVFKFLEPICSKKVNAFGDQINDYSHAASLLFSTKFNGAVDDEDDYTIIFHVDLSALFLLTDPIDEQGNIIDI
ncbi:MAG: hypothetical protein IJL14_04845 [Selenomonadaceae bacterium]|nr:hypothetical protein [Selenomonadaceae bacterium]